MWCAGLKEAVTPDITTPTVRALMFVAWMLTVKGKKSESSNQVQSCNRRKTNPRGCRRSMIAVLLARRVDGCSGLLRCGPSRSRIGIGRQDTLSYVVLIAKPSRSTPQREPPRSMDGDPVNEFTTSAIVVEPNTNKTKSDNPYLLASSLLVSGFSVPQGRTTTYHQPNSPSASLTWTELMPPGAAQRHGEVQNDMPITVTISAGTDDAL